MSTIARDVIYALRKLGSARGFTATAVLTLALGIGGTTAIFTLIHAVMLKSLPVVDPATLYRVGDGDSCCVQGGPQDRWGMFSYPLFERIKAEVPEFSELTAFQAGQGRLAVRRENVDAAPRPLRGIYVTGNYFATLGVNALAGRMFTAEDDRAGASPVVVLAYHAWQGQYAGDPAVIGASLVIESQHFTVAGVAPPGFFGETLRADPPDMWVPLQQEPLVTGGTSLLRQPISSWLRVIGRLKPGASIEGMDARLTSLLRNWALNEAGYPANWLPEIQRVLPQQSITVVPAGAGVGVMKEQYGRSLNILLGVCGLVLLIACANVANLLLARAVARRGQTAVRLAMGASSRQIITEALVESIVLAVAGALAGLLVSVAASRLLLSLAFSGAAILPIDTLPSPMVLAFAVGLALLTGLLFGTAPAWFATHTSPIEALRGAGRTAGDKATFARKALLVVQATLSVVLVAGSTMLGRSLGNLQGQELGFARDGRVLVAMGRPSAEIVPGPRLTALYRDLETRLERIPGVQSAGLAMYNPLTDNWGEGILIAGKPAPAPGTDTNASWDRVSTAYLQELGVKLTRGRHLAESDSETTEAVAIVNEAFVKKFFKADENPLDQHFGLNMPENVNHFKIVGVVADPRFAGFQMDRPPRAMFFLPMTQTVTYANPLMKSLQERSLYARALMLVTNTPVGVLEPQVARVLAETDPNLALISMRTMELQISRTFDQQRAVASLAGLFGAIALVLAAIGLYGVTAYSVARRSSEIGVRMALGADKSQVMTLVLGGAFARVGVGLLIGLPLAVGAGYLLSAQLYGVTYWDPVALTVATGSLALAAFIASLVPAVRAAALAPMKALRTE